MPRGIRGMKSFGARSPSADSPIARPRGLWRPRARRDLSASAPGGVAATPNAARRTMGPARREINKPAKTLDARSAGTIGWARLA